MLTHVEWGGSIYSELKICGKYKTRRTSEAILMFFGSVFCCFNYRNIWVDIINASVDQTVKHRICLLLKEKFKFKAIETGSCFLGHSMPLHGLIGLLCGPCMFSEHVTFFQDNTNSGQIDKRFGGKKRRYSPKHILGPPGNVWKCNGYTHINLYTPLGNC